MTAFDPLSLGLMFGGAGLSGLSSLIGGGSQNRAARQARDYYGRQNSGQMNALGGMLYGQPYAQGTQDAWRRSEAMYNGAADPGYTQAMRDLEAAQGGPLIQQMRNLQQNYQRQGGQLFSAFNNKTAGLANADAAHLASVDGLARGAESMAQMHGQGRERLIRRDAKKGLADADDTTRAALAAAGLSNSSILAGALTANRRENSEAMDSALQANSDSRIGNMMNARNQRIGVNERIGGQNRAFAYQRDADRSALLERTQNRNIGLAMQPINTMLGVQQGSVMNPWLNQNTSQYYPGNSGLAGAMGQLGGGAAAYGSYMMGQQNANNANLQGRFNSVVDWLDRIGA